MVQSGEYSGKILQALLAIEVELSQVGIGKDRTNQAQKFKFRGIDDVLNALSPLWAKHKVVVVPKMLDRQQTERKSNGGGALFDVVVTMRYDFVSAEDGSYVTAEMPGEAMDSGDKATNKAISTAYKYAVIQLLSIPIEGSPEDRDSDFTTHKVSSAEREQAPREHQAETAQPEVVTDISIEAAISRMTQNEKARQKLAELLLKAYSVMTLDQIPADKVQEAISQAQTCLEQQRKAAKK